MTKQMNLRLDDDLHSWLVGRAAREHRSINGHIEHLLEQDRAIDAARGKELHPKDSNRSNLEASNWELREPQR